MNYANVWKRFVASLIDGIVLYIVQALVGFALGLVIGGAAGEQGAGAAVLVATVAGIVISWLYYAIQESSPKQATIGKQAMGLVVTDMNGEKISFAKASIRSFAKYLSAIILAIGYIMAFFTEKKQGLHDMIAGTLVIQK
jgi:uncharacterized RDD family membrane protein YckC